MDECDDPVILGRYGLLYPYDEGTIGVIVESSTAHRVLKVKQQHPEWELFVEGDTEAAFLAPVSELDVAAEAIKSYRRRTVSPEAAARAAERLRRWREESRDEALAQSV